MPDKRCQINRCQMPDKRCQIRDPSPDYMINNCLLHNWIYTSQTFYTPNKLPFTLGLFSLFGFQPFYPLNPFVLWLESQNGQLVEPPHLQKDIPFGFSTIVPSDMVISQAPNTLTGPFSNSLTFAFSGI